MACKKLTSLELSKFCGAPQIKRIAIFPNGTDGDLDMASLEDKAYLDALAKLGENAKNKLIMLSGDFEENEPIAAENEIVEFTSGKKIKTGQKNGGQKFMVLNSEAARRTLREIDGLEIDFIYLHEGDYISGLEAASYTQLKPITGTFMVIGEYKDKAPVISVEVSYSSDYELNKAGISVEYSYQDIFTAISVDFEVVSSSTASIIFKAYSKDTNIIADLTVGAAGAHEFSITKSGVVEAGAVAYDANTTNYTFTPTAPMTVADAMSIAYNEQSVTDEAYVTSQSASIVIPT